MKMGVHGIQHISDLNRFFERTGERNDGTVGFPDVPDAVVFFLKSGGNVLDSYRSDAGFFEFIE